MACCEKLCTRRGQIIGRQGSPSQHEVAVMNRVAKIPVSWVFGSKGEQFLSERGRLTVVPTIDGSLAPIRENQKAEVATTREPRESAQQQTISWKDDPKNPEWWR
jgi:hypothetical protein